MTRQLGRQARGGRVHQPTEGDKAEVRQGTENTPQEVWEFGKLKTAQGRRGWGATPEGPQPSKIMGHTAFCSLAYDWAFLHLCLWLCPLSSAFSWVNLPSQGCFIFSLTERAEEWRREQIIVFPLPLWNWGWCFLAQHLQTKGEWVSFLLGKEGTQLPMA